MLLLWLPVCYLPYAIVPLNVPVAYHHYYLSLAGAAGLVALLLSRMGRRSIVPVVITLACFAGLNYAAGKPWRSHLRWAGTALREAPASERAFNEVGVAYTAQGRLERAIKAYKSTLQINRNIPWLHYNIGKAYFYTGRYRLAIKHLEYFQSLYKWKSRFPDIDGIIGMAMVKSGRPRSAISYLGRGLEASPNSIDLLAHRKEALDKIRRVDEALKTYDRLFGASGDDVKKYSARVALAIDMGDFDAAYGLIEQAEKRHPNQPEVAYQKARIFSETGEREAALKILDEARRKFPGQAQLWILSGHILEDMEQKKKALEMYEHSLDLPLSPGEKEKIKRRIEGIGAEKNKEKCKGRRMGAQECSGKKFTLK